MVSTWGCLKTELTFTAEYYNRQVDDLLLQIPLAPSLGYAVNYLGNFGKMKNWGYEFQAAYSKATGDLRFTLSANVGITRNEVTDLYIPNGTINAGANADYGPNNFTRTEAGHSIQGFYGWKTDGLFQSQAEIDAANALDGNAATKYQDNASPGDIRFKDLNGDGVINSRRPAIHR